MKGVKMLFISHNGYFQSMCKSNGHIMPVVISKRKDKAAGFQAFPMSFMKQGVIYDSPKCKIITAIKKDGITNENLNKRKNINTNFIRNTQKSIFHQMAGQWLSLYDKGKGGEELTNEFY